MLADLYPYRWYIVTGLVLVSLGAAFVAYRRGWHLVAWRNKPRSAIIGAVVLAIAVPVGYYLISPLFERSLACEASPLTGAGAGSTECEAMVSAKAAAPNSPAATAAATPPPSKAATVTPSPAPSSFEARVVRQGTFHGADDFHFGEGKALLIETAPGQYVLRFEEFSVRNGPDLYVYMSTASDTRGDGSLELGKLKATDGAFNYDVPEGADISRYKSAIVWCKQFSVLFAAAPLLNR